MKITSFHKINWNRDLKRWPYFDKWKLLFTTTTTYFHLAHSLSREVGWIICSLITRCLLNCCSQKPSTYLETWEWKLLLFPVRDGDCNGSFLEGKRGFSTTNPNEVNAGRSQLKFLGSPQIFKDSLKQKLFIGFIIYSWRQRKLMCFCLPFYFW